MAPKAKGTPLHEIPPVIPSIEIEADEALDDPQAMINVLRPTLDMWKNTQFAAYFAVKALRAGGEPDKDLLEREKSRYKQACMQVAIYKTTIEQLETLVDVPADSATEDTGNALAA